MGNIFSIDRRGGKSLEHGKSLEQGNLEQGNI
jgi:hypothetical protein